MSLFEVLADLGIFLLIINTVLYFKSYKQKFIAFKIFCFYLLVILTIQLITRYTRSLRIDNLYISHYYFIGQLILLSIFFKQIIKKLLLKKIVSVVLVIILIVLGIYYVKYPLNYYKFNVFEIVITSVPLMLYSFLFFIQKMEGSDRKFIYIVSGFFLYILCSTLLFTAGNIKAEIKKLIWYSNAILYIVYQVLIFVEWYKNFRMKKI